MSRRLSPPTLETPWQATGRQRHKATRWFGLARIWIEERRMVYRSRNAMPPLWTGQTRWRRARRRDRAHIAGVVTFEAPPDETMALYGEMAA